VNLFSSIKFRLTVWYLLVIVGLLAAFGAAAYAMLSYQLHRNMDEQLRTSAIEMGNSLKLVDGQISFTGGQLDDLVLVYDANGDLVHRLGPNVDITGISRPVQLALFGQSSFVTRSTESGQEVRLYASPLAIAPNTRLAMVVGKPPTEIEDMLSTVKSILGLSALVAIAIAAVGGSLMAERALNPVLRMTGAAENIGESDLSRRMDVHGEDELGRLASTLNRMMERLETAFNRQRQFAADASHELRTPLAVIQAESTLALDKERTPEEYRNSLEAVAKEAAYMRDMLGNLLLMARSEAGKEPMNSVDIDLKDVIAGACSDVRLLAREKDIQCEASPLESLIVEGDRVKLRQLFMNILENSVRYTPSGGSISASAIGSNGSAVVSISDTGIGIPAEKLPLIFERFYRVDKARSRAEGGAGLGLSIAKSIAEAHGGRIEVESQAGKGSTFRIFIPLKKSDIAPAA